MKTIHKVTLLAGILLLCMTGLLLFKPFSGLDDVYLKSIYDGDTITIERDGLKVKIRLAEVDCPERDQPYGKEAREFVQKFLEGKTISISAVEQDRYGRTVAKVRANNDDLGEALVENGYAWVYTNYSKDKELIALQDSAKRMKIGLWKDHDPIPPWKWRKSKK
jgi:endonuclease YncB( thermonuclease family)